MIAFLFFKFFPQCPYAFSTSSFMENITEKLALPVTGSASDLLILFSGIRMKTNFGSLQCMWKRLCLFLLALQFVYVLNFLYFLLI